MSPLLDATGPQMYERNENLLNRVEGIVAVFFSSVVTKNRAVDSLHVIKAIKLHHQKSAMHRNAATQFACPLAPQPRRET